MFEQEIFKNLHAAWRAFSWKVTLSYLAKIPRTTKGERFKFWLEVMTYLASLWVERIKECESAPDYKEMENRFAVASNYSHNPIIVRSHLEAIASMCCFDAKIDSAWKADTELAKQVLSWELSYEDFVWTGQESNGNYFPYSVTWASWEKYAGNGQRDLMKLNMWQVIDLIWGLNMTYEHQAIKNYIDENKKELWEKKWQPRIAYIALAKYMLYPDSKPEIIQYVESKLEPQELTQEEPQP